MNECCKKEKTHIYLKIIIGFTIITVCQMIVICELSISNAKNDIFCRKYPAFIVQPHNNQDRFLIPRNSNVDNDFELRIDRNVDNDFLK